MKFGITYLYTISKYGYPPSIESDFESLKHLRDLGFHYLEMEGLGEKHTEGIWNNRKILKEKLEEYDIHIHNFCAVDPDLTSMDGKKRKAAYERFKKTAEIGVYLGTETLHLASYAPPVNYIGSSPYKLDEEYSLKDGYQLHIPEGFAWERVWECLVESCEFTAEVAREYGRTVIMEPRIGELICSSDSILRLIKDVNMPNFKANFDTGHFSAQRENVPLALMKLKDQFANIHIADNNPKDAKHITIGKGTIDWYEFFRILKLMNYDSYLGIDLSEASTIEQDIKDSLEYISKVCKDMDIKIEW